MNHHRIKAIWTSIVRNGRLPGQLVIQFTDKCNASCQQCGMRAQEPFPRKTLSIDDLKRTIDHAAASHIQALSFTGGEPLLMLDTLAELLRYAGSAGIKYLRTGTNGYCIFRPEWATDSGGARAVIPVERER